MKPAWIARAVGRTAGLNVAVLGSVLLAGCTLGPNFAEPGLFTPSSWFASRPKPPPTASVTVPEPLDPNWWALFDDPILTELEQRVTASNLTIRLATVRLQESRFQRGVTAADEFPNANANASYTREKVSSRGVLGLLGGSSNGAGTSMQTSSNGLGGTSGAIPSTATGGSHVGAFNLFQYGFDSTWEVDFWGRVRRQVESADATLEASAESRRSSLVSVSAELARDYLQLRGLQRDYEIAAATLASDQDSLHLTQARQSGGLTTGLDSANAAAQVASTASQVPQLQQQIDTEINAISLLLGEPPGALAALLAPVKPVPPVPPAVPVGLPSELVQRRPDIRQAEAQLHAATADIGAAEADFFPKVTLSGSAGAQALRFKDLGNLGSFGALQFSGGPSLSIPIFEGGRLKYTLDLRKAQQQEAAVNYQQTVLQAFHDVDNALTAYSAEQLRRTQLARAVTQARVALQLARSQYVQGLASFLDVLTAQRTVFTAEQQYADSTTVVSTNLVQLYKALGGGWENRFPRGSRSEAAVKLF